MTYSAIDQKARELLVEFWREMGKPESASFFPVDGKVLIQRVLGWQCEAKDLVAVDPRPGFHVLGRCTVSDVRGRLVEIATTDVSAAGSRTSEAVQRWTWAHEAGHIALGHVGTEQGQSYECRRVRVRSAIRVKSYQYRSREELAADVFARSLLMPEKAVRSEFRARFSMDRAWAVASVYSSILGIRLWSEPSADHLAELLVAHRQDSGTNLCEFFGVSRESATRRLVELGIVYS